MILVDSTVYIDLLRRKQNPVLVLRPWIETDRLLGCGVIRVEVLRGIVQPRIHAEMSALFNVIQEIKTDDQIWQAVASMAWKLDRQGTILPLTDLLIGCCALEAKAALVTADPHFTHLPGLKLHAHLPSP